MTAIISSGDIIHENLPRGIYTPVHIFQKSINYKHTDNDSFLSIVTEEAGPGPINLVVKNITEEFTGDINLDGPYIHTGSHKYSLAGSSIYHSTPAIRGNTHTAGKNVKLITEYLTCLEKKNSIFLDFINYRQARKLKSSTLFEGRTINVKKMSSNNSIAGKQDKIHNPDEKPGSPENILRNQISKAMKVIEKGDLPGGARLLRGVGFGFTPAGDDFIMGLILSLNILKSLNVLSAEKCDGIKHRILRVEDYGNAFICFNLKLIADFRVTLKIKLLIEWLFKGNRHDVEKYVLPVTRTGHSSGIDLLCGLITGMKLIN